MSSSLLFQLFETGIQQSEWVIVSHNNSIATISKHKDLRSRLTELLHLLRGARADAWQLGLSLSKGHGVFRGNFLLQLAQGRRRLAIRDSGIGVSFFEVVLRSSRVRNNAYHTFKH